MRNTKKAFTLVELIVVITILAILGTIAFISLQGYSADARNSKRTSDINTLAGKMNIQSTEGTALLSFVSGSSGELSPVQVAWTGAIAGNDYAAWVPNYLVLWVKSDDFKDSTWDEYKMWATTKMNGKYELAASLESWTGEKTAKVIGTFNPRTAAVSATWTVNSTFTTFTLAEADYNKFFKGDTIEDENNSGATIYKVSGDLSTLTFSNAISPTGVFINLVNAESDGLIRSVDNVAIPVTNGSNDNLPY